MRSERQQRFSFRKYAVGLVSVLVGCLFCGATVLAEEQEGQLNTPAIVAKEESQAVNPTAGQDKDSAAALPTDKSVLKLLHKSNPYLIKLLR